MTNEPNLAPQILVVAGDYDLVQQAREGLREIGFFVQNAYSHRDALYAIENEVFQMAVVDSAMYDRLSGEPTIDALKQFRHVPIILVARNGGPMPVANPPIEMVIGALDKRTLLRSVQSLVGGSIEQTDAKIRTQPRTDELETLVALGKTLTEVLDLSEVLNRIVEAARRLTRAEEGMILLPDNEGDQLYLRARVGIDDAAAQNFRIKTEDTLAGHVFSTGQPTLIGAQGPQKVKTQYFVNSLVYVPILSKGRPIGVLGVSNKNNEDVFELKHQQLLLNLASYAAVAIENARIHEEALRRTHELQSLVEASRVVNSSVSLNETLPNICQQFVRLLGVNWSEIHELNHDTNQLELLARYQHSQWRANRNPIIRLDRHPDLRAALDDNVVMQVDAEESEADALYRQGILRMLALPIVTGNEPLGMIRAFYTTYGEPPAPETLQRACSLGLEALTMLVSTPGPVTSQHALRLTEEVNHILGADWSDLSQLAADRRALLLAASYGTAVWLGAPRPSIDLSRYPELLESVNNSTLINCQADRSDLSKTMRTLLEITSSQAVLGLPLVQRGQGQGLVLFGDVRSSRMFSDREIDLGQAIVGQAATAIENARLVHDLELSLHELKDAQERLIQAARLSAMGELAAAVAHQINNPLTTILVDTELMLLDEEPETNNYRSLTAIYRAGKRAAGVVRRLLATARPTEENGPIVPIDIVDNIEGILSLVRQHIEQDRIRVIARLPETKLPRVWAVQGQLDDIWLNLLLNAHDALIGRPGAEVGIEVNYAPNSSFIEVVVWDNGPGIPQQIQTEIFKPFFTTKPVGEGTGLGLHIVRQVIERTGGSIRLHSAPEKGAQFLVRLPVQKGEE